MAAPGWPVGSNRYAVQHVGDLATAANANPVHELTDITVVPIHANDRGMVVLQVQTGEDRRLGSAQ